MEINYTLVIVAAVVQFVLGAVWYSPLMFGNTWMKIMGGDKLSREEITRMQKEMTPFYILQFMLGLVTIFVLANQLAFNNLSGVAAYSYALFIWLGYIMPIQVGSVIWANTKKEYWWKQILIMISYQLVAIMLAAFILTF